MAADSGQDPFRRLPNDLLHHVLSFLPEDDALQTCVLDTRWRDFWRRATSLDVNFYASRPDMDRRERLQQVVNLIIHLRGNSPLAKCEISSFPDESDQDAERLVQYALTCQVEQLIVISGDHPDPSLPSYDAPFVSRHLKILEFCNVNLEGSSLDFSSCPVLEDLTMEHCHIHARSIRSRSLKRMCITEFCDFPPNFRVSIVAPDLVSLQLERFSGLTPSLDHMPFLVSAYVGLGYACHDLCKRNGQSCGVRECACHAYPADDEGLLLNRLSNAVALELIANPKTFIYRWDLERRPIFFGKLKTLLLNDWFTPIHLVCILQHTPNLEMLTLQLDKTKSFTLRATESQETTQQPFVCTHLKVVNIECIKVDEGVRKILNILTTRGILREQISIKDMCFNSLGFSFEKPPHFFSCPSSCSSSHTFTDFS